MEGLAEYGVEVDEDRPRVRVLIHLRPDFDVHVECIRYIFEHHEEIGDRETSEDGVGGATHLSAAEHGDIDGVGSGTNDADNQRYVPV